MEEAIAKNEMSLPIILKFLQKNNNLFNNLNIYLYYIDNENGCDFYTNFYFDNKNIYDFSFLNAFNYNTSDLIKQCNNISFGVNKDGITSAGDNLIKSVIVNYYEFKKDNIREKNLIDRVNNQFFIGAWKEIDLIYDKIIINIIICWIQDLNKSHNKFYNLNYFVFSIIMGLIIIIFIAYLIFFPIKTLKENDVITQIEPSLYNTIMF